MTEPIHRALGLTDDELDSIVAILGRDPNHLELAMFSVMWSEHCSYKSSRIHLGRLPTEGERVLVGPGENAGVIDVGDGIAAAIRIESHNHPSAIEPYQGAATGAGGILRDIFTMGARPIALMDPLRFGPLDDARSRWIAEGVVAGISGYGNSVGVPTVGGETVFDETYADNPLVNVLCLGVLPTERLVLGQASGVGNLAVLLGATTGRDGIGGVSVLASAGFSDDEADQQKRPSVQVGDPYEEKRLIEACLELLDAGLVVGIQDLGGAGLTCATSETASRGGVGMDVDVAAVPLREDGMDPYEVMTSESQERMLAIVEPADLAEVEAICRRWEVRATVVGTVTESDRLRILADDGAVLADVPGLGAARRRSEVRPPHGAAGRSSRSARRPIPTRFPAPDDLVAELIASAEDTSWVWSQYDHQLFLNTVEGTGGDAVVLRLKHPTTGEDTGRGLALTTDGNHRWCAVDPRIGTAMCVAESVLNLAVVGAHPVAVVNCLNFGNPEHADVMWQLSEAIDGMTDACRAFGLPVVGGNVSLYNESRERNIDPTPVIGLLGMVDQLDRPPPGVTLQDGGRLIAIGPEASGLAGSAFAARHGVRAPGCARAASTWSCTPGSPAWSVSWWATTWCRVRTTSPPAVWVERSPRWPSSPGIGVTVARVADHRALFAESPSRVVVCVAPEDVRTVLDRCALADVPTTQLGMATGDRIVDQGSGRRRPGQRAAGRGGPIDRRPRPRDGPGACVGRFAPGQALGVQLR